MDIDEKIKLAEEMLASCTLCPRECGVNRLEGETGFCRTADRLVVSSWSPHYGEERPLVGRSGSGTIFFTHCNLGCIFCQNYSISHLQDGCGMSEEELASVMMDLQEMGCENINLVTPTHQVPMILKALKDALEYGLRIPIVYNCGGYESIETLRLLEGVVDIYMPDFKFADSTCAEKFCDAPDYPDRAKEALKEMHRQVGDLVMNERGVAVRGLLVRHLVMPGGIAGTEEIMRFIATEISPDTYVNIMDQYHPCFRASEHVEIARRITGSEFRDAVSAAVNAGIKRIDGVSV